MLTKTKRKKREKPKGPSPNARSVKECERRGWIAQIIESRIPHTFITRDLFGVIDIVAVTPCKRTEFIVYKPGNIVAIQATGSTGDGNHAKRRAKILAEPRAKQWLEAGGLLYVWTWNQKAVDGKPVFTLREEQITLEMFDALAKAVLDREVLDAP